MFGINFLAALIINTWIIACFTSSIIFINWEQESVHRKILAFVLFLYVSFISANIAPIFLCMAGIP